MQKKDGLISRASGFSETGAVRAPCPWKQCGWFNAEKFRLLKKNALLVNMSHGGGIGGKALIEAVS